MQRPRLHTAPSRKHIPSTLPAHVPRAQKKAALAGGLYTRQSQNYRRSKIAAIPWPPPMHMVTSAYLP